MGGMCRPGEVARGKTLDQFAHGQDNPGTTRDLQSRQVVTGRVASVRRGLYTTVPAGVDPGHLVVHPFLLTGASADDMVLACHTALQFHGKSRTVRRRSHGAVRRVARDLALPRDGGGCRAQA